ncbi:hybrid sensor histidine kinase/response regulator [Noviherbaspirillum suwonense]|uniref:histidine kinase n=1 Tax=Noviherbaspirillum suwonense TaxID=1224511 RepID=A0ABY1QEB2_9BURK|nr:response regulator [Noviherbaspirillum suwonense]SMP68063.1 PAS domain S-box-containing protein [Noviherbaspirillum suwonense]
MTVTIGLNPDTTRKRIRDSACLSMLSGTEDAWPPVLSTAVDILSHTPLPMLLLWGSDHVIVYNQAFALLAGERDARVFGKPARQVWPQLWPWADDAPPAGATLPAVHVAGAAPFALYFTPLHAGGATVGFLATAIEAPRAAAPAFDDDERLVRRLHEAIATERMAADAERHARADESDFLRSLFEQAPGFTAVLRGPQHIFTVANAPYRDLIGRDDIIGKPVREVLPEVVEQGFITLLDEVYASGEPYVGKEIEVRLRRRDNGAERSVLLDFLYQPIRGRSGAVAGIFVQGVDVTEHTANSERLRIAQEAGGIGSFEWFPEADRMVCSDTYRRLWGLPDDVPVTGSMLVAMVDPAHRHEVGPLKLGVQDNPLEYAEYQITRADNGEKRWLARRGKVVERNGEKRYLGVAFDITHRKQIDQALRDSEARIQQSNEFIRLLLDSTEEGFYSIDREGVTTLCNRAFMRMLGFSQASQVIGHRLHDLIHHTHPDGTFYRHHDCPILRTARTGESALVEDEVFFRVDGSSFPVEYRAHPVRRNGVLEGALCTFTDISTRRQHMATLRELNETLEQRVVDEIGRRADAENALRQAQKMEAIGQLTGGVAHDFNNVLQVIGGNLQLLQSQLAGNQAAQKRLDTAVAAVLRGAKLSSQLLAFARRQPLQPVVINLGELVRNTDDLLRRTLGEAIIVRTAVAPDLWNTLADPGQIENVILNLAINARDAMQGEGRLTIELANATLDGSAPGEVDAVAAGDYVMLAVSDTGSGMSQAVMEKAFEPFFTTKPEGEGTGLGLSMAYGFVRQSGGTIRIYSEVGVGTTIRIYLPRSLQAREALPDMLTGPVHGGNETILVAEDDPDVQSTVVDILSTLGYRVLKADDGEGALVILRSGMHIDLLFTDVVMPGPVRSVELARQARLLVPDIAVLFTSGYPQNAIVHGGRLDEGVELLSKPYRRTDLARKIRHIFANRQQARGRIAPPPAQPTSTSTSTPTSTSTSMPISTPQATSGSEQGMRPDDDLLRILVVEDNEDSRILVCELLNTLGHTVTGVGSAEEALEALGNGRFDTLFTDVSLPGISGVELARKAAVMAPGIAIVFASGYGASISAHLDIPSRSLAKPYDIHQLRAVLAAVAADASAA